MKLAGGDRTTGNPLGRVPARLAAGCHTERGSWPAPLAVLWMSICPAFGPLATGVNQAV